MAQHACVQCSVRRDIYLHDKMWIKLAPIVKIIITQGGLIPSQAGGSDNIRPGPASLLLWDSIVFQNSFHPNINRWLWDANCAIFEGEKCCVVLFLLSWADAWAGKCQTSLIRFYRLAPPRQPRQQGPRDKSAEKLWHWTVGSSSRARGGAF